MLLDFVQNSRKSMRQLQIYIFYFKIMLKTLLAISLEYW